jgi:DNA modification methylase
MLIEANWDHNYTDDCVPNFIDNMSFPRHRWYEFKEGFGNSLVERAINDVKETRKSDILNVLDPFSGSGTTPLTALQNNCNAIGIEVNPFMNFVGETKSIAKRKAKEEYEKELKWIIEQRPIEIESSIESTSSFSSDGANTKWLFNKSVLRGFEALKHHIKNMPDGDIYLLALFSSVMQCCNAKKDGKCLRYKKQWDTMGYSSKELREIFEINCRQIIDDIEISPLINGERHYIEGDSRKSLQHLQQNIVDLIVFSPPYLNSFDYSDIYRPELFIGGFVNNNAELRKIREKTVRSHVQYKWNTTDKSQSSWARNIAEQVKEHNDILWNKDIPDMINAYFYDMEQILKESYRVASKGAQMWFVVATSAYAGVEVPVDLILADIAVKQGWELKSVNALRKLRTSSQCSNDDIRKIRLRESLIICRK